MSYATLQTSFAAYCKRTDLPALLPTFVALFEAKLNRDLRVRQMEQPLTGTIDVNGEIAQPAGFLAVKSIWPSAFPEVFLGAQTVEKVKAIPQQADVPTLYAVGKSALIFNGSGAIAGYYYQSIPGLQAAGTNWLETAAPDAYLFGALAEAYLYVEDVNKAVACAARSDQVIQQIQSNDMRDRYSTPLTARKR